MPRYCAAALPGCGDDDDGDDDDGDDGDGDGDDDGGGGGGGDDDNDDDAVTHVTRHTSPLARHTSHPGPLPRTENQCLRRQPWRHPTPPCPHNQHRENRNPKPRINLQNLNPKP